MSEASAFKKGFLARTKQARKRTSYSQNTLGELLGLDQGTYKQYETRSLIPHRLIPQFCALTATEITVLFGVAKHATRTGDRPTTTVVAIRQPSRRP